VLIGWVAEVVVAPESYSGGGNPVEVRAFPQPPSARQPPIGCWNSTTRPDGVSPLISSAFQIACNLDAFGRTGTPPGVRADHQIKASRELKSTDPLSSVAAVAATAIVDVAIADLGFGCGHGFHVWDRLAVDGVIVAVYLSERRGAVGIDGELPKLEGHGRHAQRIDQTWICWSLSAAPNNPLQADDAPAGRRG
jgi:hypothetical protein